MTSAAGFLVQTQNPDGGWGYRSRGMSYVEPTAAAMLALSTSTSAPLADAVERAQLLLLSIQRADGGWGIGAVDFESGWMTSWACLALASSATAGAAVARGAKWLLNADAWRITDPTLRAQARNLFHIDTAISGWSWVGHTASWVHPTALAISALIASGRADSPRVQEGIQYLLDRSVESGGWNLGDPELVGKGLPATIQDSVVALLALHAAGYAEPDQRIALAIRFLLDATSRAQTAAELAWGIYGLRSFGLEVAPLYGRLNSLQAPDGSWEENPFITAISMLAQGSD